MKIYLYLLLFLLAHSTFAEVHNDGLQRCIQELNISEAINTYIKNDLIYKSLSEVPPPPPNTIDNDRNYVLDMNKANIEKEKSLYCFMQYSFFSMGRYYLALETLRDLILKSDKDPDKLDSALGLLLAMDYVWFHQTQLNRKIRQEERDTHLIAWSGGAVGLWLTSEFFRTRVNLKNLRHATKFKRFIEALIKRPDFSRYFKNAASSAVKQPHFARYLGGGSSLNLSHSHLDDLNNEINQLEQAERESLIKLKSRDYSTEVWHSPLWVVSVGADHNDNEFTQFSTFDFYTAISGMAVGTVGAAVIGAQIRPYVSGYVKGRQKNIYKNMKKNLNRISKTKIGGNFVRSGGAGAARGGVITLGLGSAFIVNASIATASYFGIEYAMNKAQNYYWEYYVLKENLEDIEKKISKVEGEYWEKKLGSRIVGHNSNYSPVLEKNNPAMELIITTSLVDLSYSYRYALEQLTEYLRGEANKEKNELIDNYLYNYNCTATRYQNYLLDLEDKKIMQKNGLPIVEDRTYISLARARELFQLGEKKLDNLSSEFKIDLEEISKKINSSEKVNESLNYYNNGIKLLEKVSKESGRRFLYNVIQLMKTDKEKGHYAFNLYNFDANMQYKSVSNLAVTTYNEIMSNFVYRQESKCFFGSTYQDSIELANREYNRLLFSFAYLLTQFKVPTGEMKSFIDSESLAP